MSARRPSLALIVLAPIALAGAGALAVWLSRRWGYVVEVDERDVPEIDAPPEPEGPEVQHADDGAGPLFHRRYRVRLAAPDWSPEDLIADIARDIGPYTAPEVGRFERTSGAEGVIAPGDEFTIHIKGPWVGLVRTVEVEPARFRFITREGHMEAGQIEFRAERVEDGDLVFTIESWARSRDALVSVAYDDLGVAKLAQQAMWTFFCERVASRAGGEKVGEIEVVTERAEA